MAVEVSVHLLLGSDLLHKLRVELFVVVLKILSVLPSANVLLPTRGRVVRQVLGKIKQNIVSHILHDNFSYCKRTDITESQ